MNVQFRNLFFCFAGIILSYSLVLESSVNNSEYIISSESDESDNQESPDTSGDSVNDYNDDNLIKESERAELLTTTITQTKMPNYISLLNGINELTLPKTSPAIEIPDKTIKKAMLKNSPEYESSPERKEVNFTTIVHQKTLTTSSNPVAPIIRVPHPRYVPMNNRPLYHHTLDSSSSSSESLENLLMKDATQFFIVPNLLILSFIDKINKMITERTTKKKARYLQLLEEFTWRTVNKTNHLDNGVRYSLDVFLKKSICVDDLYKEHRNFFLQNKNPDFIKSFLKSGLSLEHQNDLFTAVFTENSPAYLNPVLAHTLILHGYTLELLENYRNQREHHKQENAPIPPIKDILKSNIAHLKLLSQQLRSFNPCVLEDGISQELKNVVTKKINCFIRYYNIEMNRLHRTALFDKNLINAKKYLEMSLDQLSSLSYQTMTTKALTRYDKISLSQN